MKLKHLLWKYVTQDPDFAEEKMSCKELQFENVDKDFYARLLNEAKAAGAEFDGVIAKYKRCTFDWNYDEVSQTLNVTCTDHPLLYPCGTINSEITGMIERSRGVV